MNIIPGDDSMTFEREIHRGKIFYMTFKEQVGSEQQCGRASHRCFERNLQQVLADSNCRSVNDERQETTSYACRAQR